MKTLTRRLNDARRKIREEIERLAKKIGDTCIIVALLGAGGRGIEERRRIKLHLEKMNIITLIPEDDIPEELSPSLLEEAILTKSDIDLIFVNVESWGTATEFAQFHDKHEIAYKLRVLVPAEYHPIYGREGGYLTDLYLTHLTLYGHVYAYGNGERFPKPEKIILTIAMRFKELKALGKI